MVTDGNGEYLFDKLISGKYYIEFSNIPSNNIFTYLDQGTDNEVDSDAVVTNTFDTTAKTNNFELTPNENNRSVDAGIFELSSIGNFVFNDMNADGYQDAGDNGIESVVVKLFKSDGTMVGETTTDSNGEYLFNKLIPGEYYLEFSDPSSVTIPGVGTVN